MPSASRPPVGPGTGPAPRSLSTVAGLLNIIVCGALAVAAFSLLVIGFPGTYEEVLVDGRQARASDFVTDLREPRGSAKDTEVGEGGATGERAAAVSAAVEVCRALDPFRREESSGRSAEVWRGIQGDLGAIFPSEGELQPRRTYLSLVGDVCPENFKVAEEVLAAR